MASPVRRPRNQRLRAMVRSSLFGECPNCVFGHLFDGPFRAHKHCASCGMCLEPDGSNGLGTGFVVYVLALFLLGFEGVALGLLFGLFPGFAWVLALSAVLLVVLLYRPVRGWWVWLLWTLGELE